MFGRFGLGQTAQQVLQQIAQRESGGNYSATVLPQNCPKPPCTASGAYQIIDTTWQMAARAVGIDTTQYPTAASAPPALQDAAAGWLLQTYGPNASITWAASAPAGGYPTVSTGTSISTGGDTPIIDVSGDAATTPTADLLTQFEQSSISITPDLSVSPLEIALAVGVGAIALLALR